MTDYSTTPSYRSMWESYIPQDFTMPYMSQMPYVSGWGNNGYNWNGAGDFSNLWSNFSSGSASSEASGDAETSSVKGKTFKTYEEYEKAKAQDDKARIERKAAEAAALEQRKEVKTALESTEESIKDIKTSKKKDGSAVVSKSRKDMNFWQKTGRLFKNMGKGIVNIGRALIGYDENGKWDWKKALRNGLITAAAVGACFIPVVGPAIGYGLAAVGLGLGTVGVVKSSVELSKAKTDEEKDKAQQNLGANIFTMVSSTIGLRGVGSAFRASTAASGTSAANSSSKLVAVGKGISNFFKDVTVNAWKGTGKAIANDKAAVAANGFWKTFGSKISNALRSSYHTNKFEKKKDELLRSLEERIKHIDDEITASTTAKQKLLLTNEKKTITSIINKVKRVRKKSSWDDLANNKGFSDLAKAMKSLRKSKNKSLLETIKRISKENDDLISKLEKLSKLKLNSMREKSFISKKPEINRELEAYTRGMSAESHWWNPKFGNKYQKMLGHNSRYGAMWRGLKSVSVAPAGTWVKADAGVFYPMYWEDGITLTPEMVETQLQELEAQKEQLKAALKELEN